MTSRDSVRRRIAGGPPDLRLDPAVLVGRLEADPGEVHPAGRLADRLPPLARVVDLPELQLQVLEGLSLVPLLAGTLVFRLEAGQRLVQADDADGPEQQHDQQQDAAEHDHGELTLSPIIMNRPRPAASRVAT